MSDTTLQTLAAPAGKAPLPGSSGLRLQRQCDCGNHTAGGGECESCKNKHKLQRKPVRGAETPGFAPAIVHDVLRSPGRALDPGVRAFMGPRFGQDFSRVRVHTDARAAESALAVGARAYTVGRNVVFGDGAYDTNSPTGQRLLAHELAHVVQQKDAGVVASSPLPIGSPTDAAELAADRIADAALSGAGVGNEVGPADHTLRRTPLVPQDSGEDAKRLVTLPTERRGEEQVKVHVWRSFQTCPCARVDEVKTGIFYNPDLDNLAIAYRSCRGSRSVDVYGQLQSNANAFLGQQAPPVGTARVGIDVNVVGRKVSGRVVVEAIGSHLDAGDGVGGKAQVIFQGNRWRVFLEPQFIRHLGDLPTGTTPNDLEVSLGAQFGDVRLKADFSQLLDATTRSAQGTICIPSGIGDICPYVQVGPGGEVQGGLHWNVPLDVPETRPEDCHQCVCPPPVKKYQCMEDVLPRDETVPDTMTVQRPQEFHYYFGLDRTSPSEDPALKARSQSDLETMTALVRGGAQITGVVAYASPEAREATHNQELSQRRAEWLQHDLQSRLGSAITVPAAYGGGELLGYRPSASASSQLGEAITSAGFRSAEDLSAILTGDEIPNQELSAQFQSLFRALPVPADRLALFGLAPDDPMAPRVLQAITQFERSGGRGPRPWEGVFRLLRVGIIRTTKAETVPTTRDEHHTGSFTELPEAQCTPYAERAEATLGFGPQDISAQRPDPATEDQAGRCQDEPKQADRARGCNYRPDQPSPPLPGTSIAPRRLQ